MLKTMTKMMTVAALAVTVVSAQAGAAHADGGKDRYKIKVKGNATVTIEIHEEGLAGPNNGNGDPTMDEKLKAELGEFRPVQSSNVLMHDFLIVRQ